MTERWDSRPGRTRIPVLMMAQELGWAGGLERDISKFARYVAPYGIAAHVACFRGGGARWSEVEAAGIPTLRIPFTSFWSPSVLTAANALRRYIADYDIRILHAFDAVTDLFCVPVGRVLGIRTLASQLWRRSTLPRSTQLLLSVVDRIANGLFVNSYAVARELTTDWGVPEKRIHVCHNGFEPAEFHTSGRQRPPLLAGASVVIGTVAVLREEKNLALLLDAFLPVHAIDPNAILLIVGDGPMKPHLLRQAERLGLGHRCLFREATPNPADWMRAIDVFVLCSRSESFPNALLEAMACGCCPVASRVGGTSELVRHGETGLLFDSGETGQLTESLSRLATDPDFRSGLAKAAAQFVHEHLTMNIAAERLSDIYRQLLGKEPELRRIKENVPLDLDREHSTV